MDTNNGFSQLVGLIPPGLMTFMAIAGAAMSIGSIIWWFIKRGKNGGSGMSGFPIWWVIGGGALATFAVFGAFLGNVVSLIIKVVIDLGNAAIGWF